MYKYDSIQILWFQVDINYLVKGTGYETIITRSLSDNSLIAMYRGYRGELGITNPFAFKQMT